MSQHLVKLKCFEYLIEQLLDWHGDLQFNDFSKLKSLKLLFFASAVTADVNNDGLLSIFDNFWAMPYGHVEVDVYENLGNTQRIKVNNHNTVIEPIGEDYYNDIDNYKSLIKSSVTLLKQRNNHLVFETAFDLVELSHQWLSWKTSFNLARVNNKLSMPINSATIKSEPKVLKMIVNEFS